MDALETLEAPDAAGMRAAGMVASATPRHIRTGALAAATLLHAGLIGAVLAFARPPLLPAQEPIVVEIVSLTAATPLTLSGAHEPPPEPVKQEATAAEATPEVQVPEPVAEPAPSLEPAAELAAAIDPVPERLANEALPPPPPQRPRHQPRQANDAPTVPVTELVAPYSAPAAIPPPEPQRQALVAAPALPARAAAAANSEYVGRLLAWLARFKEYPRAARLRGIQGQTVLRLSIQADGRVEAAVIATSSGHPTLDSASIETIRRASPLPVPEGGAVELLVPIVFTLRD